MTGSATDQLDQLAAGYWEAYLRFRPVTATMLGDRRYDDRLGDPSPEAVQARAGELRGSLADVGLLLPDDLDAAGRTTRSALLEQVELELAELDSGVGAWTVDPLEGPQARALVLPEIQPVATPGEATTMVRRWTAIGDWLDGHAACLRRELAAGRIAVRTPVARTIDQLDTILATPDDELPLLAPARTAHADWPPHVLEQFRTDLAAAVQDIVRPALSRYREMLATEILPAARHDDRPGISHLAGGAEAYDRLVRVHTSLPLAADEIHRIGLDEVARIDDELRRLGARLFGIADLGAIQARLRGDPTLHFASRDEVRATAELALGRAREAIPRWFGILPSAECVVIPMPAHEEEHSTIAYYREPAPDGARPGSYYVNTGAPETRPRYEAEALAFHESIPGHHLQLAIAQERTDLPAFRRHLGPTAYVEGWALYTERLSDEMGLYTSDLDRIGVLSFDAWRACRLVVDTGMHALGWSRREAIDFMAAHTALATNNIANEVDRYIVWPGQALAYKIGQLEILRLRREAEERLGRDFDLRGFHDAILGEGALGLATLREVVERRLQPPLPAPSPS
jgi:uncharacterized protein (DUF885 family)